MNAVLVLLAATTLGADFGWQQLAGGEFECIIQISPESLEALRAGQDVIGELPPELAGIKRMRLTVGRGPVPRIGTPPAMANTRTAAAPDPFNSSAGNPNSLNTGAPETNNSTQGQAVAGAADRYGNSTVPGYSGTATGGNPPANNPPANNAAAGETQPHDPFATNNSGSSTAGAGAAGGSLLDRVKQEVGVATDSANATTGTNPAATATNTRNGVPQMNPNPFHEGHRYANAPKYGDDTRYSGDSGTAGSNTTQTNESPPSREEFLQLPVGELLGPIPANGSSNTTGAGDRNNFGSGFGASNGDSQTNLGQDQGSDIDPWATNRSLKSPLEKRGITGGSGTTGRLSLNDVKKDNPLGHNQEETPPPTFKPDQATRLANYSGEDAGPSGSKGDGKSSASKTAEPPSPWMWVMLVVAMSASLGANGWMGLLLRDSRRKYIQLLERFQGGEEEEEDEEVIR